MEEVNTVDVEDEFLYIKYEVMEEGEEYSLGHLDDGDYSMVKYGSRIMLMKW